MSLLKRTVNSLIIGAVMAVTAAQAATSSIWGAPHASVATTNRLPVDASALGGAGYNSVGDILALISGDCTVNINSGAITCTKANGISFAAVATSGSATDLSAGTLPAARIPVPTLVALGGIQAVNHVGSQWVSYIDTSGVPHLSQPLDADLGMQDLISNNATISAHGFLKKLPNDSTLFMNGIGNWTAPNMSITFTGDGTVLSSTPSAGPTMTATLKNATANSILGNSSGSPAAPTYLTTLPFTLAAGQGGTGQTTIANAFISFYESVATTLGDLVYGGAAGTPTRLAGNTTTTGEFLTSTGSGGLATAPAWQLPSALSPAFVGTNFTGTASALSIGGNAATATTAGTLTGALSANQLLGSLTAIAPSGLSMPSCSGAGNALLWTSGTGFSCATGYGAGGSVTSVTFTGDGTILSSTPSTAVTTTGTVTAALANAGAGTVLGNATSNAAAPAYTSAPVLGKNATTNGTLGLANGATSGTTITLQNVGNITTGYNYNFPITAGAVGAIETSGGGGSTANVWLADVATGQVLTSGGATTIPAWSNAPTIAGTNLTGTGASFTAGNATLAASATILATGRNINGVSFNGSANITVPDYNLPYTTQTTTYAPTTTDNGSIISFAGAGGAATWTIAAGATNGAGWWAIFENPTAFNLTVKVTTNTIDGIAGATGFIMYPGEVRLVQCGGTNYTSRVLHGGVAAFTSSTTWERPPGYNAFDVEIIAGGGSGAVRTTTGNAAGGCGGEYYKWMFPASAFVAVGSTETVTVGGTAASVASSNANGVAGNSSALTINGVTLTVGASSTASTSAASSSAATMGSNGSITVNGATATFTTGISEIDPLNGATVVSTGNVISTMINHVNAAGSGGASSGTAGGTRTGGTSMGAGAGGTGSATGGTGVTNGTAPGGGGGAGVGGSASGSGAAGQVTIRGII